MGKKCSGCKQAKPLEAFPPDQRRKDGRGSKCRECALEVKRAFYAKYPEKEAERRRKNAEHGQAWYQRNRERQIARFRNTRLEKLYGITQADYERLLELQGGCCAICGTEAPGRGDRHFAVDHDHETGRIRGLLCQRCNCGIGFFDDNLDLILKAADYVEHHGRPRQPEALPDETLTH